MSTKSERHKVRVAGLHRQQGPKMAEGLGHLNIDAYFYFIYCRGLKWRRTWDNLSIQVYLFFKDSKGLKWRRVCVISI